MIMRLFGTSYFLNVIGGFLCQSVIWLLSTVFGVLISDLKCLCSVQLFAKKKVHFKRCLFYLACFFYLLLNWNLYLNQRGAARKSLIIIIVWLQENSNDEIKGVRFSSTSVLTFCESELILLLENDLTGHRNIKMSDYSEVCSAGVVVAADFNNQLGFREGTAHRGPIFYPNQWDQ